MVFTISALLNFFLKLSFSKFQFFEEKNDFSLRVFPLLKHFFLEIYENKLNRKKANLFLIKMCQIYVFFIFKRVVKKIYSNVGLKSINFLNWQNIDFLTLPQCFHILMRASLAVRLKIAFLSCKIRCGTKNGAIYDTTFQVKRTASRAFGTCDVYARFLK